jgi:hypothetical protein
MGSKVMKVTKKENKLRRELCMSSKQGKSTDERKVDDYLEKTLAVYKRLMIISLVC